MIYLVLYTYAMLVGFVFYAGALAAWGDMKIGIKLLLAPVLIIFGAMDVIFNLIAGSILFVELPRWHKKEFTFSQRCENHWSDSGYRGVVADAFCFLLNSISKNHCVRK